jgi:hypothetical protein
MKSKKRLQENQNKSEKIQKFKINQENSKNQNKSRKSEKIKINQKNQKKSK